MLRKKGAGEARALLERLAAIREPRSASSTPQSRRSSPSTRPSRRRSARRARRSSFAFEKLVEKTAAAAGRADERTAAQVRRLSTSSCPDGSLAERVYSALPYVLRFGREAVVGALRRELDLERAGPSGDSPVNVDAGRDVLAFAPHPDDVELGCGGTLAALARARARASGSWTSRAARWRRAARRRSAPRRPREAARILGARFRETLDLGDGGLRTDRAAELRVVEAVRRARPRLVLAPLSADRHPDHERAGRLVPEAAWYAGLAKLETGPPAAPPRPGRLLRDVRSRCSRRSSWTSRRRSRRSSRPSARIAASSSTENSGEPETYVSSKGFFDGIEARARALGRIANVEYAEGFVSNAPPTLADPVAAFRGYEGGKRAVKIGITCYPTFGGSGVVATELGHELARRGHDVHFITYAMPSRLNVFARPRHVSRGDGPVVSALPVRALRPRARDAHGRRRDAREASTSSTSTTRFRTRSRRISRARCSPRGASAS